MPIFEYTCNACHGRKFSALVGVVADAKPPTCPKCGGPVRWQRSPTNGHLSGACPAGCVAFIQ